MNNELRHPLTALTAGSMLNVSDGQGLAIVVFEGLVWITQNDDLRDFVLAAGDSFRVDRPGLTLVEALRDSKVMVLATEVSTSPAAAIADTGALYHWAREQRSLFMARALHRGWVALRKAFARAWQRPAPSPAKPTLAACLATR
jgi:Protein of unknown function (DUF2917)